MHALTSTPTLHPPFEKSGYGRGVARIFQGGVQFAEILLTTPTFLKNHAHYSQTKSHSVHQLGCFYIVVHKRVAWIIHTSQYLHVEIPQLVV